MSIISRSRSDSLNYYVLRATAIVYISTKLALPNIDTKGYNSNQTFTGWHRWYTDPIYTGRCTLTPGDIHQ